MPRDTDDVLAQAEASHPVAHRDIESGVARVGPVAGTFERCLAHGQHAMEIPRHELAVSRRKRIPGMIGPLALANDAALEDELLLAKELQDRRDVDQRNREPPAEREEALIACADVGCSGLGIGSELAHRADPPADALLRLEHADVEAVVGERERGSKARDAGADDGNVAVGAGHARGLSAAAEPASAGARAPGRPGRQQSAGQRSCIGGSVPSVMRESPPAMRSTSRSRTIAT